MLGVLPLLALTTIATPRLADDVAELLQSQRSEDVLVPSTSWRGWTSCCHRCVWDAAANHLRDVLELAELRLTFVMHVGCKSKPFADVHGARTEIRLKARAPALKVASEGARRIPGDHCGQQCWAALWCC